MLVLFMIGCGSPEGLNQSKQRGETSESITGSGSSALFPLAQDAAEKYKAANPGITITFNAGGSGTGLKQVADGTVDIGNSDVTAESKLDPKQAKKLVDHKVCAVTIAAVVNQDLSAMVTGLTKQQLIDIFTSKIMNWKEVGGPDETIILITRPFTSGTRILFQTYALDGKEEASAYSLETDDSGTLLQIVSSQKGAIGYVALPYLMKSTGVVPLAIDGVMPTLENTYNGTYPVWGYEHMYTNGEASETVKAYLNYIMSEDYGSSMEAKGYCVTSKLTATR
jgi:phosphate transport system substrate-binding protein